MESKYTKELLSNAVKESYSYSDVCRKLGLKPFGSRWVFIKSKINKFNIDVSHFNRKKWNTTKKSIEEIFTTNSTYTKSDLRKRFKEINIVKYACNVCDLSLWLNQDIVLHLDHINGNDTDNRLENLRWLCPNCHQQTDTWGFKKRKLGIDANRKAPSLEN